MQNSHISKSVAQQFLLRKFWMKTSRFRPQTALNGRCFSIKHPETFPLLKPFHTSTVVSEATLLNPKSSVNIKD